MRYPVGIADMNRSLILNLTRQYIREYRSTSTWVPLDDNDTLPYRDAYDEVDAELVKDLIGVKMMPDRWHLSQSIYKVLGIPAQFVTYENTGHEIKSEMIDDITAFFEANAGNEIVEIVPHQYPSIE